MTNAPAATHSPAEPLSAIPPTGKAAGVALRKALGRRGIIGGLTGILAVGTAPAVVRAASLMPIKLVTVKGDPLHLPHTKAAMFQIAVHIKFRSARDLTQEEYQTLLSMGVDPDTARMGHTVHVGPPQMKRKDIRAIENAARQLSMAVRP